MKRFQKYITSPVSHLLFMFSVFLKYYTVLVLLFSIIKPKKFIPSSKNKHICKIHILFKNTNLQDDYPIIQNKKIAPQKTPLHHLNYKKEITPHLKLTTLDIHGRILQLVKPSFGLLFFIIIFLSHSFKYHFSKYYSSKKSLNFLLLVG